MAEEAIGARSDNSEEVSEVLSDNDGEEESGASNDSASTSEVPSDNDGEEESDASNDSASTSPDSPPTCSLGTPNNKVVSCQGKKRKRKSTCEEKAFKSIAKSVKEAVDLMKKRLDMRAIEMSMEAERMNAILAWNNQMAYAMAEFNEALRALISTQMPPPM